MINERKNTQVVILAGGKGTRLNDPAPKPLVQIGNKSLVEHIMERYVFHGYCQFLLLTGYRHEEFEKYFYNKNLGYNVELLNTGEESNTGERIRQAQNYIKSDTFHLTYGDGVSNIPLDTIQYFFEYDLSSPNIMVSLVHPLERFGVVKVSDSCFPVTKILQFNEKPTRDDYINGGFMVCDHGIFDYIKKNDTFEKDCIPGMVAKEKATAYKHESFWACLDTQKDLNTLTELWNSGNAPWNPWKVK